MFIPRLEFTGNSDRLQSVTRAIRLPETSWPAAILEKPIIAARIRQTSLALVCEPEAVRQILGGKPGLFPKWLPIYRPTAGRDTGPNSMFVTTNERWRILRHAFAPMFAPERAELLVANAVAATHRSIRTWHGNCDINLPITRVALDVIWRTLLGDEPQSEPSPLLCPVARGVTEANSDNDLTRAGEWIAQLAKTIAHRDAGPAIQPDNPFAALTRSDPAAATILSKGEIDDNFLALLYAGQETTVLGVVWALWLIGQAPDLQRRLRAETEQVLGGRRPTVANLRQLVLLDSVLKETLRLFSPSVTTVRTCTHPVTLAGQELPSGSVLVVPIYAIHRHRALWREPDKFIPARFADDQSQPMSFIPFSAGQHTCLAAKSSWLEMLAILATVIGLGHVTTFEAEQMRLHTNLVLRPSRNPVVEFKYIDAKTK
ncbi:cytochrome P450 [Marinobacterium sedimentorum]|uniref:cytochrome P450 n=1 Tax=Marinobacterium sedimentorum TaxID=2927804 RepID=UPI0020C72D5B|nr:cytochrome P450 [Marinobacterium sedimentorum]MCP8688676.1 cytochrome P450 [Marinobacterium sedimentorum]